MITLLPIKPEFEWSYNQDGVAIRFNNPKSYEKAKKGSATQEEQLGFVRMQMLLESGHAEVRKIDDGIFIRTDDVVRLDEDTREGFFLPPSWIGSFYVETDSYLISDQFLIRLILINEKGEKFTNWTLNGAILKVIEKEYLPTAAQFAALKAYLQWCDESSHDYFANASVIASLSDAKRSGCSIDLACFNENVQVYTAKDVSVHVEPDSSGDLILLPVLDGDFPEITAEDLQKRVGQTAGGGARIVYKVASNIVLLDEKQTEKARALVQRGKVPKSDIKSFSDDPYTWLADHVFSDIDMEFSPRVTGIGYWKNVYSGAMLEDKNAWLDPFEEKPKPPKKPTERKDPPIPVDDDIDEDNETKGALTPLIHSMDEDSSWLENLRPWKFSEVENIEINPDYSSLSRSVFDHQKIGINWLLKHGHRALKSIQPDQLTTMAGALFADDMGLGKTFTTLVFIKEWIKLWNERMNSECPAILVIAPLSLLENWKAEVSKSFGDNNEVFTRILLAQSEADLNLVRRGVGARDRAIPDKVEEYGLVFSDGTPKSIDMPRSLVITTYQTLRDYRFSFAQAVWSAVIFDEAQNIKNPNALQTIAAKSLKATVRITLTGTPVENHLGDFWTILDASETGHLGTFSEFREKWVNRMRRGSEEEIKVIGQGLRDHVGELMLRRMKEEELGSVLPRKIGHMEMIPTPMSAEQEEAYDSVLSSHHELELEGSDENRTKNNALVSLWRIRQISLHPNLMGEGYIGAGRNAEESRRILEKSGKLRWLLEKLDSIKKVNEKVLIFCVQKKLQQSLAQNLSIIYGVQIPVINGDTQSSSKVNTDNTRLGLIKTFSESSGFGICILSPIAAGAGLNIVEANHVIHLERHWNPAKEDQATDRAYRIGQKRDVFVYLPTSTHSKYKGRAFDEVLHSLIQRKRGLQDALGLVPAPAITTDEIITSVLSTSSNLDDSKPINVQTAIQLGWDLFESLIGVIYKKNAENVIITMKGGDKGCDVVVLGWGKDKENILIQCKTTSHSELNSEKAVREVEGAVSTYENKLGVKFPNRYLHSNAQRFSNRTKGACKISNVKLFGREWIREQLTKYPITLKEINLMDARRVSI